jgi:hypothetical protein
MVLRDARDLVGRHAAFVRDSARDLDEKPATFLDLLWAFEGRFSRCKTSRKRRRR